MNPERELEIIEAYDDTTCDPHEIESNHYVIADHDVTYYLFKDVDLSLEEAQFIMEKHYEFDFDNEFDINSTSRGAAIERKN